MKGGAMSKLEFDTLSAMQTMPRICMYCLCCMGCCDILHRQHVCAECQHTQICRLLKNVEFGTHRSKESHGICKPCLESAMLQLTQNSNYDVEIFILSQKLVFPF
jgi:hypothetical protein